MSKSMIYSFENEMRERTYEVLREAGMEDSWANDL